MELKILTIVLLHESLAFMFFHVSSIMVEEFFARCCS
jgi:hypothetical protein